MDGSVKQQPDQKVPGGGFIFPPIKETSTESESKTPSFTPQMVFLRDLRSLCLNPLMQESFDNPRVALEWVAGAIMGNMVKWGGGEDYGRRE